MERIWTRHYEKGVPEDFQMEPLTLVDIFERSAGKWGTATRSPSRGRTSPTPS